MLAEEVRPLKRPKLGIPDFYPQEDRQKEVSLSYYESPYSSIGISTQDELSISALNLGFRQAPPFSDEVCAAIVV